MNSNFVDSGTMTVLMKTFQEQRRPRALNILEKVNRGECLSGIDISFLEEVLRTASEVQLMIQHHPECEAMASEAMHLYHEITARALENENQADGTRPSPLDPT